MPHFLPLNDWFIDLDGSTAYISVADSLTLKGKQKVDAIIHLQLDALPGGTYCLFGKSATADFAFTVTTAGVVAFTTRRAGGAVSSTGSAAQAILPGREYILRGVDDGTNVKLYLTGSNATLNMNGQVAATTNASQTGALVKDTNPYLIGAEAGGTNLTPLRVYEAQVKFDDQVVFRFQPHDGPGTTLRDLSQYAQAVTIVGTEGTNYYWGNRWSDEPVFPGSVNAS